MIQELIYTSHKGEGLKRGSGGGFCTVVCTQGMAPNIVRHLEQLSGYKHPFDVHDERSSQNPLLWRFLPVTIGGIKYAALSRIADVKGDYSGRSNKLAHHVLVTEDEFLASGPAAILARSGVCVESWDGKVKEVARRKSSEIEAAPFSGPCAAWKSAAGDAGWAGVIAERLTRRGAEGFVRVIFPVGTDSLRLVDEVFALLPAANRWQTGFSTYVADSANDCKFEFLLDGTREASVLRKDPRKFVVDLCKPLPAPGPSVFVDAARSGDFSALHPAAKKAVRQRPAEVTPAAVDPRQLNEDSEEGFVNMPPELGAAESLNSNASATQSFEGIGQRAETRQKPKKNNWLPLLIAMAAAVLILCVGLAYLIATNMTPPELISRVDDSPTEITQPIETIEVGGGGESIAIDGGNESANDSQDEVAGTIEQPSDDETSDERPEVVDDVAGEPEVDPPTPVNRFDVAKGFQIPEPNSDEPVVVATFAPASRKLNLNLSEIPFNSLTDSWFKFQIKEENQAWEFKIDNDTVANLTVRKSDGDIGELVFQWSPDAKDYYQDDPVGNGLFYMRFLELMLELEDEEPRLVPLSPPIRADLEGEDMLRLVAGVYHHFNNVEVDFQLRGRSDWKRVGNRTSNRAFRETHEVALDFPKEVKVKNKKRVKARELKVPIVFEIGYEVDKNKQLFRNGLRLRMPYKRGKDKWTIIHKGGPWEEAKKSLADHPGFFKKNDLVKKHENLLKDMKQKRQNEIDQNGVPVDCVFYIPQGDDRKVLLVVSDGPGRNSETNQASEKGENE